MMMRNMFTSSDLVVLRVLIVRTAMICDLKGGACCDDHVANVQSLTILTTKHLVDSFQKPCPMLNSLVVANCKGERMLLLGFQRESLPGLLFPADGLRLPGGPRGPFVARRTG